MHTRDVGRRWGEVFHENCYYEEKSMSEAMRGTFDPGYLNYTLGKLVVPNKAGLAKRRKEKSFSLEKFHNDAESRHAADSLLREILLKDQRSGAVL
jgi:hypothetical protein